ncbi:unnamed protein product [Brassica rapa]|uniref:Uncharacterized protein n=3 Tax=Brassica TaxID=3705 RepID=A0A8D9DEY5_BRACM|nr:unnamed protein product [Brassica napus]CAG7874219.1 unnamed protein product [Brassica rapa]
MSLCIDSEGDMEIYGSPDVVIRRCAPAKSPSLYRILTPSPPPSPSLSPPPSPATIPTLPFHEFPPGSIEYYTGRLMEFVPAQDLSPTGTLPAGLWSPQPGLYTTYTPHAGLWTPPPYSSTSVLDTSTSSSSSTTK